VFLFGFAKNERENVSPDQLAELKAIASGFIRQSDSAFAEDVREGRLQEVDYDEENEG
jgi:hypothetical protein